MTSKSMGRPHVGAAAPDIALYDMHGTLWRLADRRGHHVVLIFHRHIH